MNKKERTKKKKIREIQKLFNEDKIKEYYILGNPCSGKSTFADAIIKNLKPYYKVFYIDLSDPDLNNINILKEVNQLSFYHTVILLENVHDNIKLFKKYNKKITIFPTTAYGLLEYHFFDQKEEKIHL